MSSSRSDNVTKSVCLSEPRKIAFQKLPTFSVLNFSPYGLFQAERVVHIISELAFCHFCIQLLKNSFGMWYFISKISNLPTFCKNLPRNPVPWFLQKSGLWCLCVSSPFFEYSMHQKVSNVSYVSNGCLEGCLKCVLGMF